MQITFLAGSMTLLEQRLPPSVQHHLWAQVPNTPPQIWNALLGAQPEAHDLVKKKVLLTMYKVFLFTLVANTCPIYNQNKYFQTRYH